MADSADKRRSLSPVIGCDTLLRWMPLLHDVLLLASVSQIAALSSRG